VIHARQIEARVEFLRSTIGAVVREHSCAAKRIASRNDYHFDIVRWMMATHLGVRRYARLP
jgi:hypothetical protein